ncbi:MAG TPA: DNA-processing protein DprA [Accumulibacter sp.]|jgi:DNA processing protein|nr:DNA-processing protein DprA [Accumulibacter sp.]HQC80955.1 DNA-processing protein DprA [Accumulibacter sp.]
MTVPGSLVDWLRFTLIPGIGGETQRKLLTAFGLPEAVFAAGTEALSQTIGNKAARLLHAADNRPAVERALAWAASPGHRIVCLADADYPRSLLQIPDPPTLLYVVGRVELLNQTAVAVVGSRNPTAQGIQNAERFASSLTQAGLSITSGLALGIDAAAHRGALTATGDTVAFIGTGIDRMYPAANHSLAREIALRGAIVSEFPLGTPPAAANFPRRNRLISGLSRGVLVVEATVESGSLISARLAAEQGREVFAIPGSIHSPQSRGCHKLIKQGAKLVETVEDVLDELSWTVAPPGPESAADQPEEANALLQALGFDPCSLDELVGRSGLTTDVVSVMLLHLELDGRVATLPGGRYQRIVLA